MAASQPQPVVQPVSQAMPVSQTMPINQAMPVNQAQPYQPMRRADRARKLEQQVQQGYLVQCPNCGSPLQPGQICSCQRSVRPVAQARGFGQYGPAGNTQSGMAMSQSMPQAVLEPPDNSPVGRMKQAVRGFLSRSGLMNDQPGDAFENGRQIVPELVQPMGSEQPVRQYEVATLRTRFLGMTLNKAGARLQVTSERLILRAAGAGLQGRSVQQQEIAIGDVGGVQVSRVMTAHPADLVPIVAVTALLAVLITMMGGIFSLALRWIPGLVIGLAGVAFGLLVRGWWMPKSFLCLGAGASLVTRYVMGGMSGAVLIPAVLLLAVGVLFALYAVIRP